MYDFLMHLFDTTGFPPRWHCGNWTAGHGWLHIVSDLGVWSAYLAIPCVLGFFVLRRKDIPFRGIFLLFGAFILACGTTHLMEAIIFWWPAYRLAGLFKLFTAIVSWVTVVSLIPIVPKVLAMRTSEELEREIAGRKQAACALEHANAELGRQVDALEASEQRFRLVVDGTKDYAIFMLDPNGRVASWNLGAERVKKYSSDEIIGHHFSHFYPAEDIAAGKPDHELEIASSEGRHENEGWRLRGNGDRFWANVVLTALRDDNGNLRGFSLINMDMTERKQADENSRRLLQEQEARHAAQQYAQVIERQSDALREADRRKNEFLAILAHELRNPLAPISNGLQVLRLADDRTTRDGAREMMDRQLSQLVRLVDDLLDVSRISSNKLELRKARITLASVVENAIETARPLIDSKGHTLNVAIPASEVYLDADLTRLAQVFWNLLNNSAKYTDPGGRIDLVAVADDRLVTVEVRDTGIGIPAEHRPRLFEMFSQVDHGIDRSQGGLGIGLALVKGLVEMHGGSVENHSAGVGKGCEFIVRLPVAASAREPDISASSNADAGSPSRRVLVVDDNRDAAASLAMMLRLLGHDTRITHDGGEAVKSADAFRPDVVLLDIGLPKLNGYEACRVIRQQPWGKDIVIIAATGWGQDEDRRRSREAGFDHHLVKPVDPTLLVNLIATLAPAHRP